MKMAMPLIYSKLSKATGPRVEVPCYGIGAEQ